ncbi:hypothetical protein POM88_000036 [Heracleum sosnowskyi]|uniref:Uncharacterized protein n=1 Tax=Heracleum sosnowskyi TaxID=360622 RepID=A0AAD8JB02_9APIA|nr:hypothetical protein POM88_000036 [Heracleum sosnowskyi]
MELIFSLGIRLQCMSTERYVIQMSKLHDMLMLCVRSLDCIVSVHVTDFGNHGSLVIDGLLLQCMRSSVYDSKKAKRDKLGWFVGNSLTDEFVMNDITANIILKWKDDPFQNYSFDNNTNYDRIISYFNLQKSGMVYDKALLSILQQHKKSVQRGYNNKLVYPDRYETIFTRPLPVAGIYSKGTLTFGIGLKITSYFNFQKSEMVYDKALLSILQRHKKSVQRGYNNKLVYPDRYETIFTRPLPVAGIYSKGTLTFGIGLKYDISLYFAQLLHKPNKRKVVIIFGVCCFRCYGRLLQEEKVQPQQPGSFFFLALTVLIQASNTTRTRETQSYDVI